ncbi:MAG TPA: response regulator [Bacillota bacterium]|nr:response regulator [Bacillota bacterium]
MKALLVDDAALARTMIRKLLEMNGFHQFLETTDGEEAVRLYKNNKPDLVIMDVTMPGMDGITALKKIIELDNQARVIICSSLGERDIIMEAVEAGAKHYIIKPYEPDKVLEILRTFAQ